MAPLGSRLGHCLRTVAAGAHAPRPGLAGDRCAGTGPSGVQTTATIVVETPHPSEGASTRPGAPVSRRPANVLVGVWLAGVAVGLCSLFAGVWRLSRVASGARLVEGRWGGHVCAIASLLGLKRTVQFRETTQPALLVTWGARRAEVLLPAGAASWTAQRIRVVVAHELAHVRRGDWPIQLLGELLRVVYWFHPLAWLACGQLRQESERACDDVVLGLGIARTEYAAQLVALARTFNARRSAPRLALAVAHPSTLQRRIRAMLNLQLDRRPLSLVSRLCGTLIILLAAAPIAAIGGQAGATVSGTVTDPTGRAIPGVNLTLANPSLDFKVQATTNAAGAFEVPVIAGTYQLEARHPGFAMQSQRVTLGAGQHADQSMVLKIGSLQETVTVAGGPATDAPSPRQAQRPIQQCTPSSAGGQIVPPMKILDVRPILSCRRHGRDHAHRSARGPHRRERHRRVRPRHRAGRTGAGAVGNHRRAAVGVHADAAQLRAGGGHDVRHCHLSADAMSRCARSSRASSRCRPWRR